MAGLGSFVRPLLVMAAHQYIGHWSRISAVYYCYQLLLMAKAQLLCPCHPLDITVCPFSVGKPQHHPRVGRDKSKVLKVYPESNRTKILMATKTIDVVISNVVLNPYLCYFHMCQSCHGQPSILRGLLCSSQLHCRSPHCTLFAVNDQRSGMCHHFPLW